MESIEKKIDTIDPLDDEEQDQIISDFETELQNFQNFAKVL